MIKLRIYLRTNRPNLQGEALLYFIVDRDCWISTGIHLHEDDWDPETSSIKKSHPNYYKTSPLFQLLKSRAEQCISNYHTSGDQFSSEYFKEFVFKGQQQADNPPFFDLLTDYVDSQDLSVARMRHYMELKNDIKAVAGTPRLFDINYKFACKFRQYLQTKKGFVNNENTIIRKMKQIKAIIHYCQKLGLLKSDPLALVKLKEIKGSKLFLTVDELQQLENLYKTWSLKLSLQRTLHYFLFSCYTGLRYSDVCILKDANIINNCVATVQEKTNKPVLVPLISKARELLCPTINKFCFKTYSNQASNRFLKEIMIIAGIDKKITFHCSRHTFGTLSIFWAFRSTLWPRSWVSI